MNFTNTVKNEILKRNLSKKDKKAFLAGFVRASGEIIYKNGEYGFQVSSSIDGVSEFICYLTKGIFNVLLSITTEADPLNKKERQVVEVFGDDGLEILTELDIYKDGEINFDLSADFLQSDEGKKSFIKGVFLGSGSCTLPSENSNTGYHLEFVFTKSESAISFMDCLASVFFMPKLAQRKGNFIVYIKSKEEIKDLFAFMGLSLSALKLTDLIIEKDIKNNANRQSNCDVANLKKQISAFEKYLKAINIIEQTVGLSALDVGLRAVAIARRDNPNDSLTELSEKLNLSKSCLNHRLRKLLEIAENLS